MMLNKKTVVYSLIQGFMLLLTVAISLLTNDSNNAKQSFIWFARYSILVDAVIAVLLVKKQRKVATVSNVFFLMFVLFQFGLPIVYALRPNHNNYYINLFDDRTLYDALRYSQMAIQLFGISFLIGLGGKDRKINASTKWKSTILSNPRTVTLAALALFILTGIFVIPINGRAALSAFLAGRAGFNISNEYRGAMSENGLLRFMQQFYFPSALLYLCFTRSKNGKRIISALYLIVALMLVAVADRNAGITALLVFVFYKYYSKENRGKRANPLIIVAAVVVLGGLSVFIAEKRMGGSGLGSLLNGQVIVLLLEEMGFNFTSICFTMSYIPKYDAFKLGLSYFASILLLVPKSFDFLGLYTPLNNALGETWLWNMNNAIGRTNLDFGVGFSMIAESYYNFAWFGLLLMLPLGWIVSKLLRNRSKADNPWSLYIRLAMMLSLFTLPRRQFASMLKGLEYTVLFMMLYILVCIKLSQRKQ